MLSIIDDYLSFQVSQNGLEIAVQIVQVKNQLSDSNFNIGKRVAKMMRLSNIATDR